MSSNFLNIQNSAQQFTIPMPFQHLTGDFANATLITSKGSSSKNTCDAECKNDPLCEFFTFTQSSATCNLYSAESTSTMVTGIRIEPSLRNVGMSNIYSNYVPNTTRIQAPTSTSSSEQCETQCYNTSTCNVYTYDMSTQACTLYGTSVVQGATGVSKDIITVSRAFVVTPSITLASASATSTSITVKGTLNLPGSSTTLDIYLETQKYGTCTQAQFTSASGFTLTGLNGVASGNVQVKATDDPSIVSGVVSVTVAAVTQISITSISYVDGKSITMNITTSPNPGSLFMNFNGVNYPLIAQSSTMYSYTQTKRLWEPGTRTITVSSASSISLSFSVQVPSVTYGSGGRMNTTLNFGGKRYVTHTFEYDSNQPNYFMIPPFSGLNYDVIIVGGGGGGGGPTAPGTRGCGGGGGGGVLELKNNQFGSSSIALSIGTGGIGGVNGNGIGGVGQNGNSSVFGTNTVPGGGGGAGAGVGTKATNGSSNGSASGGGGSQGTSPGITTSTRQVNTIFGGNGFNGYDNTSNGGNLAYGGGGGGASGNATTFNGANGYLPDIPYTITQIYFGSGGGGGINEKTNTNTYITGGSGGASGGGKGGLSFGNTSTSGTGIGSKGEDASGYGCGGGGGASTGSTPSVLTPGGNGSNGVVIVRYLYEDLN